MSANVVEILVTAKDLAGPTMARLNAQVNGASKSMAAFHKTALIAGAGLVAMGAESVKMASKFDASMQLLHTQAGVSQDKIAGLKKGVLDLAGKVGQDPDSLAESLYHVESNFESTGISGAKALKLVETAAKGATIGHANLVDVTNALTAAVASGIPGVENFDKAMGTLNATVGTGDMKMQDLADAFGTGMLAAVKGYGVTIQDVGAGLAVFGDNNVRGAKAGTEFRMMIQGLAHPVATAKDELSKLGLAQDDLAKDMQKGGLNAAMKDLVGRMKAAGVSSKEQGQVITDLFGKKAGQGISMLVSEFDKLESKYPAGVAGANKFGEAWAATQKTFSFQMKALQSSFDALMISLGTKLIPPLQSFVSLLLAHKSAAVGAAAGMAGLLAATVAVSAAMKVAAAATIVWNGAVRGVAAIQGVLETVALRAMYMKDAFIAAGSGAAGLRAAFASLSAVGRGAVALTVLAGLAFAVYKLSSSTKEARVSVDDLARSITSGLGQGHINSSVLDDLRKAQQGLVKDTDASASGWDRFWYSFTHGGAKFSDTATSAKAAANDFRDLGNAIGKIAQNKGLDTAQRALDLLAKQGVHIPTKYLRDFNAASKDAAVESKLTAASMGLFGDQAVATQKKLDGEAQSAKGLEESIMALNAVHRAAYDAETAFYQAMSDAHKALKENGKTLDINTDAGRKNRSILSDLAAKTEDYVLKANKQHFAVDKIDKVYQQGRKSLIDNARALGDNADQAKKLADLMLNFPGAKQLKMRYDDKEARSDLNAFNAALKRSPGTKSVTLTTLSKTAETVLENFGFRVTHLKNGSVKITAVTGAALSAIRNVQGAVNALHGKNVGIGVYTTHYYKSVQQGGVHSGPQVPGMPGSARGGLVPRYAGGGDVQIAPNGLVRGPGTGTSDDILALFESGARGMISDTEFVVNARSTRKYLPLLQLINKDKLGHFAKGGLTQAEKDARKELNSSFGISYFGRAAGYKRTPFEHGIGAPTDINALVDALNQAAGKIRAAFSGKTESNLLKHLNSVGKSLISHEKALAKVTASLDKAKDKLNSLKDAAAQLSDNVKSNLISSANITKNSGEGPVTLASIKAGQKVSKDRVTAFASALKALKAKGFSASVIQQVAEAGIDGGGLETAGALLQASASEVKTINATQAQIASAAGSAGKTTASAVYDAAIKAQTAVVDRLTRQQDKLEKAMASLAKSMEKLIQKALGHKATGGIVGMAASGGLRSSLTWVGEQGPELLDLPAGSRVWSNPDSRRMWAQAQTPWSSMLTTQRHAHYAPAAPAGGARQEPIVLEIRSSGSHVDELLLQILRKAIRVRGGDVQFVLAGTSYRTSDGQAVRP
ncbi:phage tail tape measure protein [Streptomyces sp. NPDC004546]|uniref:phage tail tape measure protein n=1 Tax=Streptomyces sp. NPDC004546 TaxID=3154282 RepID=UPI0033ADE469